MKEEIIEKLIQSPNKDDVLLGLEYSWKKFKPDRIRFYHYLNTFKISGTLDLDIYINKEVNIRICPGKEIQVYTGGASPLVDVETIYI